MTWPLVSIIIVSFNGGKLLEQCLNSVLNTNYPNFEVILVDNASSDGSIDSIEDLFGADERLRIVRNRSNMGFARANNIGVKISKGDYIVFLNQDTRCDQHWLHELIITMKNNLRIGAAQPKILLMDDPQKLDSTSFIDYLGIEPPDNFLTLKNKNMGQLGNTIDVFYARGAALMIRREVLDIVGAFDPDYFINYEDIDLSWRLRLVGFNIVMVLNSIVYHKCGLRQGKGRWSQGFFHVRKNHIATMIKNYELKNLVKYLPLYIFFVILHAAYSIVLRREARVGVACIKGILWNISSFRSTYIKRLHVQKNIRKVSDAEIEKLMRKPKFELYKPMA